MTFDLAPASPTDIPAIRAFNARLASANTGFQFPETPRSLGVPKEDGAPVWHEIYVAREGSEIRGGYALKRELMETQNRQLEIWNYQIPLSEGIIKKSYATLGIRLLQDAASKHENMYCLGMGSLQRPLPRLLQRFSWKVEEVPFRFRVLRAGPFLKNIAFLRTSTFRRAALESARLTGVGALGVLFWRLKAKATAAALVPDVTITDTSSFGPEADELFHTHRSKYGAIIDRTSAALNVRFPTHDPRLIRLLVRQRGRLLGWLLLTQSRLSDHKQFGNMRLGCIVDGLCDPVHAPMMIRLATERLDQEGVDLIVSNQSHSAWLDGLRTASFLSGPSNFILARSPALAASTPDLAECHVNRGDGDGPINL